MMNHISAFFQRPEPDLEQRTNDAQELELLLAHPIVF